MLVTREAAGAPGPPCLFSGLGTGSEVDLHKGAGTCAGPGRAQACHPLCTLALLTGGLGQGQWEGAVQTPLPPERASREVQQTGSDPAATCGITPAPPVQVEQGLKC